jgi:glucose/arabinose dehydrogenase
MKTNTTKLLSPRRAWRTVILGSIAAACVCAVVAAQQPQLPKPFATPSANNRSQIVSKPDGAQLKVPAGFDISVFMDNFQQPRTMLLAPNGDVFVAESNAGSVVVLRDTNKDGTPDMRSVYAEGLQGVFGMAFHEGYLYLGRTDSIVRYKYQPGDTKAQGTPEKLIDMPTGGHRTRNIIFSPDGKKMYVAVGSMSNKSAGEDPRRAAINEYNPDGSGHRIFASGLRNPVGLAWQPETSTLWTSVNERDTLGDDLVPDYITSVKDGGFYGWPYSYIGSNYDPEHVGKMPDLVKRAIVPDVLITAHSAAVSVNFYTGTQFPERYRNGAFVGLHGSWNRSKPSGYRVSFVPFKSGKPSGPIEDFVTGWLINDGSPVTTWGRPVGTLVLADGSLLIADDGGSRIWRVRYTGK